MSGISGTQIIIDEHQNVQIEEFKQERGYVFCRLTPEGGGGGTEIILWVSASLFSGHTRGPPWQKVAK